MKAINKHTWEALIASLSATILFITKVLQNISNLPNKPLNIFGQFSVYSACLMPLYFLTDSLKCRYSVVKSINNANVIWMCML